MKYEIDMRKRLFACTCLLLLISTSCSALKINSVETELQLPQMQSKTTLAKPVLPEAINELAIAMLGAPWLETFKASEPRAPLIMIGGLEGSFEAVEGSEQYVQLLVAELLKSQSIHLVISKDGVLPPQAPLDMVEARQLKLQSQADFFLQSSVVQEGESCWLELNLLHLNDFAIVWRETRSLERIKL